jgi:hypothetical protein
MEDQQDFKLLPASFDSQLDSNRELRILSGFKSSILVWRFNPAKESLKLHKKLDIGSFIYEVQFLSDRSDQVLVATDDDLRIVKI